MKLAIIDFWTQRISTFFFIIICNKTRKSFEEIFVNPLNVLLLLLNLGLKLASIYIENLLDEFQY